MLHLTDLDELIQKIRSSYVKEYVTEALTAYRAGAYRAAVATTWVAVCIDIIEKIRELSLAGDAQVRRLETELDNITMDDVRAMQNFENKLITIASKDLQFISHFEEIQLERIRQDRNFCVHPTFQTEGKHINISPEVARNHLVNACNALFIHAPTKGKVFIEEIYNRITEPSFPSDAEKVHIILSSDHFLGRARPSLIRNLAIVLLKRLFSDPQKIEISLIAKIVASLKSIGRISHEHYRSAMQDCLCRLLVSANELQFKRIFPFLKENPDCWSVLDTTTRIRAEEAVQTFDANGFVKYQLPQVSECIGSLRIPIYNKLSSFEVTEQITVVGSSPTPVFKDKAIELFVSSGSFNSAHDRGQSILLPNADFFNKDDIKSILDGSLENRRFANINQIMHAGGIDSVFTELFNKTRARIPESTAIWAEFWNKCINEGYTLPALQETLASHQIITIVPTDSDGSEDEEIPF